MKVLKSFSLYTFVSVFSAGVGFFIMPVLTHYLSPTDYGIISLFNTYVALLVPVTGFMASGLISIEYYKKKKENYFPELFASVSVIPIVPFTIYFICFILFRKQIGPFLEIPAGYLFLLPVLSLLVVYQEQISNFLVITKSAIIYCISNITKTIIEISLTLTLIIALQMTWSGRIGSWLFSSMLFGIFGFFYFKNQKLLVSAPSLKWVKAGFLFGYPLIFHTLSKTALNQIDRIYITKMVSVEEMGVYNTGYLMGSILMILSGSFLNIYNPFLFERLADINEKKKVEIVRISYLFILFLFISLLLLSLLAPWFFKNFIDKQFAKGVIYVFWVGLGYFFWGIYLIFAGFIFFLKKTKILGYLAVVNILINLIFNYVFILRYGTIGAAYATALSFFVVALTVIVISNKIYKMPWLKVKAILGIL